MPQTFDISHTQLIKMKSKLKVGTYTGGRLSLNCCGVKKKITKQKFVINKDKLQNWELFYLLETIQKILNRVISLAQTAKNFGAAIRN